MDKTNRSFNKGFSAITYTNNYRWKVQFDGCQAARYGQDTKWPERVNVN